jgi:hypothetical protein
LDELAFVPTAEWVGGWLDGWVVFFSLTGVYLLLAVCAQSVFATQRRLLVAEKCFHVLCIGKVNSAIFLRCVIQMVCV